MPCRSDPQYVTVYDYSSQNSEMRTMADELTHELDIVREDILAGRPFDSNGRLYKMVNKSTKDSLTEPRSWVSESYTNSTPKDQVLSDYLDSLYREADEYLSREYDLDEVYERQVAHRKEDIKRLRLTFIENDDEENLLKTLDIDYSEPLEDQLGFDPDSF